MGQGAYTAIRPSLVPLVAAAVVYFPLTAGYFTSDDFLNLYGIVNADRLEYLLRPHGGHVLVARNALFLLFHSLFGTRAELYFAAVLATHLLNVFLLYRVVLRWTESTSLAVLGALLWGTCPVQTGALEWYSVYGQVVVATLLLVLLDHAARLARADAGPPGFAFVLWPLLLILASTSFGTGIALTMVAPVAMFLLLPPSRGRLGMCAVLVVLALGIYPVYRALILWHDQLAGSFGGIFSLYTTLGGLHYRWPIVTMFGYLMSYGVTNLVLGFAVVPPFPSVLSALVTTAAALATAATLALAPARVRRLLLALLIMTAACYAMIAAGRAMYSRVPGVAEAASRARYHYAATVPIAILLCVVVSQLTRALRRRATLHGVAVLAWLASAMVLYARARPLIDLHADAREETTETLAQIRSAIAAASPGAEVRIPNQRFRSIGALLYNAPAQFPGWAALYVIFFPSNVVDGRRVYFTEPSDAVLQAARRGRRTADLIVPAETGGASANSERCSDGGHCFAMPGRAEALPSSRGHGRTPFGA